MSAGGNVLQSMPTPNPSDSNLNKRPKSRNLAKSLKLLDLGQKRHNGRSEAKANGDVDSARYDARYKIVLLGESGVGKTSLIRAAVGEPFNPTMISTIGIDFVLQTYKVDNYLIQLQIWDTAGQERYRSLAASTFRDAKGFVIVYDVTNRESFTKIRKEWLKMADVHGDEPIPVFFAGNKADLVRLKEVPTEDAERLTQQQYAHGFFETSALTGANIQNLFQSVATTMVSIWSIPQSPSAQNNDPLRITDQLPGRRSKHKDKKKKPTVVQCCAT
ncbi:Ras-related protein RABA1b [Echinococcus granulosus]|uniref:Ras-related protein RABA1b n=1 Tax=Echinococcus granulosus TaxID=6210 RepID=W6U1Q9_ECHGR|nr:Ras-related protein RABA1b [Echinococcus granulosus]EUB54978.1 Ras-related protein RABA1b [Echinococcus granulosus]